MKQIKFPHFLVTTVLGLALAAGAGCSEEIDTSPENLGAGFYDIPEEEIPEIEMPAPPPPKAEPIVAQTTQGAPEPQRGPNDPVDETEEEAKDLIQDGLDEANDALESFVDENHRFPKSVMELMTDGDLSMLPPPPKGKKLGFDRSQRKFIWVNAK